VLSGEQVERFRVRLETHIAESQRILANAEQETCANSARHADLADQLNECVHESGKFPSTEGGE
jgi:hypothetical protein